jgi:hypothetical protein
VGGTIIGTVYVALNTGGGSFGAVLSYEAGPGSDGLAVGDVNHDGHPDVVTADDTGPSLLLGNGAGSLGPATTLTLSRPGELRMVALHDLDVDGDLDLVVVVSTRLLLLRGDGSSPCSRATAAARSDRASTSRRSAMIRRRWRLPISTGTVDRNSSSGATISRHFRSV